MIGTEILQLKYPRWQECTRARRCDEVTKMRGRREGMRGEER